MSKDYMPDRWMVLKITPIKEELPQHYRVFATWVGGFAGGDSWKMNSGIVSVSEDENCFYFRGASGSTYGCSKNAYGCSVYGMGVLSNLIESSKKEVTITPMEKDIGWLHLKY